MIKENTDHFVCDKIFIWFLAFFICVDNFADSFLLKEEAKLFLSILGVALTFDLNVLRLFSFFFFLFHLYL